MRSRIVVLALATFLVILLAIPVQAETKTWTDASYIEVYEAPEDTGEDAIVVKARIKGEKDVWPGGTFEYNARIYISDWNDDILDGNSWVRVNSYTAYYVLDDEDHDISYDYGPKFNDQKVKETGTIVDGTFEITFPENSPDQSVEINFSWDVDYQYEYKGTTRESGVDAEPIYPDVTAVLTLAEVNNPEYVGETESPADTGGSGGGFCLGTMLIALIPVSAAAYTFGFKKLKKI